MADEIETRSAEARAVLAKMREDSWEIDPSEFRDLIDDLDRRLAVLENWARQVYPRR